MRAGAGPARSAVGLPRPRFRPVTLQRSAYCTFPVRPASCVQFSWRCKRSNTAMALLLRRCVADVAFSARWVPAARHSNRLRSANSSTEVAALDQLMLPCPPTGPSRPHAGLGELRCRASQNEDRAQNPAIARQPGPGSGDNDSPAGPLQSSSRKQARGCRTAQSRIPGQADAFRFAAENPIGNAASPQWRQSWPRTALQHRSAARDGVHRHGELPEPQPLAIQVELADLTSGRGSRNGVPVRRLPPAARAGGEIMPVLQRGL